MLLLTSEGSVLESILKGFKANGIALPRNQGSLKSGYHRYIRAVQPNCPWLRAPGAPLIDVVTDKDRAAELVRFYERGSDLNDSNQANMIRAEAVDLSKYEILSKALTELAARSPMHHQFFELVIEKVFCAPASGAIGGSTSDAVGLIWTNIIDGFGQDDYVELLVHELTHNLLFLDEWVHPHYRYSEIVKTEFWCRSAIRKLDRPLDKVFHALVVAAEILLFRQHSGVRSVTVHPSCEGLRAGIRTSIDEIRSLPHCEDGTFIYPRVWQIIALIEEKLDLHGNERKSPKELAVA